MASPTKAHESEQTPGDGEGQGSLACCSPWGRKGSDTTEQLNEPTLKSHRPMPSGSRCTDAAKGRLPGQRFPTGFYIFILFFEDFLMWVIFKVFIEIVTIEYILNIVCFMISFLVMRHVGSQLPNQGLSP